MPWIKMQQQLKWEPWKLCADSSFPVWMVYLWAHCSISQGFLLATCTPALLASHDEKTIILSWLCFGIYPLSNVSGARKSEFPSLCHLCSEWAEQLQWGLSGRLFNPSDSHHCIDGGDHWLAAYLLFVCVREWFSHSKEKVKCNSEDHHKASNVPNSFSRENILEIQSINI